MYFLDLAPYEPETVVASDFVMLGSLFGFILLLSAAFAAAVIAVILIVKAVRKKKK